MDGPAASYDGAIPQRRWEYPDEVGYTGPSDGTGWSDE